MPPAVEAGLRALPQHRRIYEPRTLAALHCGGAEDLNDVGNRSNAGSDGAPGGVSEVSFRSITRPEPPRIHPRKGALIYIHGYRHRCAAIATDQFGARGGGDRL